MTQTQTFTPQQLSDMRDWCADCFSDYDDDERTDEQIARVVARSYEGGIAQFIMDGGYE